MIHLFNSRGRILFFPVKWANAVASWILGLHSSSGTIRITNTANPTESGGASVDVDMEVVTAKTKERLTGHFQTKREVDAEIERSADGSSIVARDRRIHVNDDWLKGKIAEVAATVDTSSTPSAVGSSASAGSGPKAAPSDHVHNLNTDSSLAFTNGALGVVFGGNGSDASVSHSDHDHDTTYASKATETTASNAASDAADALAAANTASTNASTALSTANSAAATAASAAAAVANKADSTHTHAYGDGSLTGFKASATKDFDTTGGTMAYDSKIKTLSSALSSEGKVKTSSLTCDVSGHSNNCLLVASGTTVTHSGNTMYDMLNAATEQTTKQATKIITDKDAPYIPGADSGKVAVTGTGGKLEASTDAFAKFASAPSDSKLVRTDGTDGTLAETSIGNGLELSNGKLSAKTKSSGGIQTDTDGISLKLKTNGGLASTTDGLYLSPSALTNSSLVMSSTRDDFTGTFQSDSWSSGTFKATSGSTSSGGVKFQVITRLVYVGGALDFFFRTLEFDSNGLLKSVSAEDSTRAYCY